MNCDQVQFLLSASAPGRTGQWMSWRVKRHIAHCPECARTAQWVHQLEAAAKEWRNETPDAGLDARIPTHLPRTNVRHLRSVSSPYGRRLPVTFATLLVLTCIAFLSLRSITSASALERMRAAILGIRTARVITWTEEYKTDNDTVIHRSNALQKVEEMWYQAGKWRKEGVWGSRIILSGTAPAAPAEMSAAFGTYYRYDARSKSVVAVRETGKQWSEFTVDAITGMDTAPAAYHTLAVPSSADQPGQSSFIVEKTGTADPFRFLCRVDTHTNLPITIDVQNRNGRDWHTATRFEFQFNQELPASLFDPKTLNHENWVQPAH